MFSSLLSAEVNGTLGDGNVNTDVIADNEIGGAGEDVEGTGAGKGVAGGGVAEDVTGGGARCLPRERWRTRGSSSWSPGAMV